MIGIRGARCGIGLFVVRVLRGVYGFAMVRPFSLVSHGLPGECIRAISGIPGRRMPDAAAVYLW